MYLRTLQTINAAHLMLCRLQYMSLKNALPQSQDSGGMPRGILPGQKCLRLPIYSHGNYRYNNEIEFSISNISPSPIYLFYRILYSFAPVSYLKWTRSQCQIQRQQGPGELFITKVSSCHQRNDSRSSV